MLQRPPRAALATLILLTLGAASSAGQATPAAAGEAQVRQWAARATASSQYGATKWSAAQATGPPDTDRCGDTPTAWAPAAAKGLFKLAPNGPGPEWLELTFARPVHASRVRVHETNLSGFVFQVDLKDSSGNQHTVWSGSDTTGCPGWLEVEFPRTSYLVDTVTVHTRKPGYEEIDAVELVGELLATLKISRAPAGAQVFLDDRPLGAASSDGSYSSESLSPGTHRLRVSAAGYREWSQEVTLSAENTAAVEARLAPATADLNLLSQPGGAQFYVDDEPRGITSAEGRLALKALAPGSHRLRVFLVGYKEWMQTVNLIAGESKSIEANLQPAGPKPLALTEIQDALKNGLSNAKVTALVKQYGVDFALSDEVEQQLRAAGADGDLLLAIAKSKK
jgi:hypothetical protein